VAATFYGVSQLTPVSWLPSNYCKVPVR